jgi:hypothetical protein
MLPPMPSSQRHPCRPIATLAFLILASLSSAACRETEPPSPVPAEEIEPTIRVATFNIEDLRSEELIDAAAERPRAAAALLQRIRPDILLINEIVYDQPGDPGRPVGEPDGTNVQRFADRFLAVPQGEGLEGLRLRAFTAPSNTGLASGFDFDNDGATVTRSPVTEPAAPYGERPRQTPEERAYGNDCWGFGTFPGQYAMALLVREDLEILGDRARTFQQLPWSRMPGALAPVDPATGEPWYSDEEWAVFRLSSKSHWDVPVRLPRGQILHILASHPTPAAFDGDEQRNKKRNHDEIRFWAEYLEDASWIVDDGGAAGGLEEGALFVIAGDLNADPDEGNAIGDPVGRFLLSHPRVQGGYVPRADSAAEASGERELDADDTSAWGMRIDYVLPSDRLDIEDGGVWRPEPGSPEVSDHLPVWVDLRPIPSSGPAAPGT